MGRPPVTRIVRLLIWIACLAAAIAPAVVSHAQSTVCSVAGTITSRQIPLPGVVVTLRSGDRAVESTSTGVDGRYVLRVDLPGHYTVAAELVAFTPFTTEVDSDGSRCAQKLDVVLTLASRTASQSTVAADTRERLAARGVGGRGSAFQSLTLLADRTAPPAADEGNADESASGIGLPAGFSTDTSNESVTANGNVQPSIFIGPNGAEQFAERFGFQFADGQNGGAALGGPGDQTGGPSAGGGGRFAGPGGRGFGAGGGRGFGGPLGRGGRGNQIRGSLFDSFDTSAFDAAPYALNGQSTARPQYLQQRFGATIGGPLVIPKIVNSPRTFFFFNYTGNHSRSPFDAYSTVPTLDERAGDLSALGKTIVDPATNLPFAGNVIPALRIDPAAAALLSSIPEPNQIGDVKNFHTVTTANNQLDDVNLRLVRTFGAPPAPGRGAGARGGGRAAGGRGRQSGASNLNLAVHVRRSDNTQTNPFPTLGGALQQTAIDVPASYSLTKAGALNTLRVDVNRQHTQSTNLYAGATDVAGTVGIAGVSSDPFDWGVPNVSFSTFAGLHDVRPSERTDRTISIGDTVTKIKQQHTLRFGGDFRDVRADSRSDANARGSFIFTGLYSGADLGDFLLGLPQQASVQFGPGMDRFRSRWWDLFVQDDWRLADQLTINAGVRYEYVSPFSESSNRLATLDVPSDFSAATVVAAGGVGPFSGALPDSIIRPFYGGVAPRVGIAWRPKTGWVLRGGYGVNYAASSYYQSIAQQLAGQPPFAITRTVLEGRGTPLPLETVLLAAPSGGSTTNSYAVDPNFRPAVAHIWNVDVQHDLSRTVQLGISYTGTRGSDLDILRAPNRGPSGLIVAGLPAYIYESSAGDSILHALTLRLRKRLTNGIAVGGSYALSRSIDDASSIGGGSATVAQNDRDLEAERGLSSFDQRHRLSLDFSYELPFGANHRWANDGARAALLGGWQMNGNAQFASGTPNTVRVLGGVGDVAGGVNGTLRANYNGAPIALDDPTTVVFFNTGAFSLPAVGTFGNAGRNTVIGPGTSVVNFGLTRNINLGQTRGLSIQLQANNVFNTVQWAGIDTVINSPTFGQVTAVRPMRRIQVLTRFRFG